MTHFNAPRLRHALTARTAAPSFSGHCEHVPIANSNGQRFGGYGKPVLPCDESCPGNAGKERQVDEQHDQADPSGRKPHFGSDQTG